MQCLAASRCGSWKSMSVMQQGGVHGTIADSCCGLTKQELAYCDFDTVAHCSCPEGSYGNGLVCSTSSFAVRIVLETASSLNEAQVKARYVSLLMTGDSNGVVDADVRRMMEENAYIKWNQDSTVASVFGLFGGKNQADLAMARVKFIDPFVPLDSLVLRTNIASIMGADALIKGPEVFAFVTGTTSDVIQIVPTGLEVITVYFEPSCLGSGCWVVDVIFTLGRDNFNALYLPKVVGNQEEGYDANFESTYFPAQFPCQTFDYDGSGPTPWTGTPCCIIDFLSDFRPLQTFVGFATDTEQSELTPGNCPADETTDNAPAYQTDEMPTDNHLEGQFEGLSSYAVATGQVGEYTYSGTLYLDDLELRNSSAKMRGWPNI
eukprot:1176304-Rhodomonas_salina.1